MHCKKSLCARLYLLHGVLVQLPNDVSQRHSQAATERHDAGQARVAYIVFGTSFCMQEVVAAQHTAAEPHALLESQEEYVRQQEAQELEHMQHPCEITEEQTPQQQAQDLGHTEAVRAASQQHAPQLQSAELLHLNALGTMAEQHEQQTLQLKLQHQKAVQQVQGAFQAHFRQQKVDHETSVACIRAEHSMKLQQLVTEHAATLSEAVSTARLSRVSS